MCCPEDVEERLNVSRETLERLERLVSLLRKWNPKINLVAQATLSSVWQRHILDSAQLYNLADGARTWADLGSGGGFPGLVLAILGAETRDFRITLIEADQRKAAFLRTAVRECSVRAEIVAKRIEDIGPIKADVVTARALAPLDRLLDYVARHRAPDGIALLLKGAQASEEIATARKMWSFDPHTIPSKTSDTAVILKIGDIQRV